MTKSIKKMVATTYNLKHGCHINYLKIQNINKIRTHDQFVRNIFRMVCLQFIDKFQLLLPHVIKERIFGELIISSFNLFQVS